MTRYSMRSRRLTKQPSGFNFDFDDSEEQIIEEETEDLTLEMMGTKIQQAAANLILLSLWRL